VVVAVELEVVVVAVELADELLEDVAEVVDVVEDATVLEELLEDELIGARLTIAVLLRGPPPRSNTPLTGHPVNPFAL